jgi:hypothetical protein
MPDEPIPTPPPPSPETPKPVVEPGASQPAVPSEQTPLGSVPIVTPTAVPAEPISPAIVQPPAQPSVSKTGIELPDKPLTGSAVPPKTGAPEKTEEQKAAAPKPVETTIYIGPTLPPSIAPLRQYEGFAGGLPKAFDSILEQCPAIRELIIPTSELGAARRAMAREGSREQTFAKAVSEFIQSKRKV